MITAKQILKLSFGINSEEILSEQAFTWWMNDAPGHFNESFDYAIAQAPNNPLAAEVVEKFTAQYVKQRLTK